eukprot:159197-Prorocentrum_minimum.AAC.3
MIANCGFRRKASNRRRYAQLVIASALTVAVLQDDDVFKFVVEKRRAAFNTLSKASGSSMTALTGAGKRSVMTLNGARKASLSKLGELRRKVFERDDSQQVSSQAGSARTVRKPAVKINTKQSTVAHPQRRSLASKVGGAGNSALQALNGGRKRTLTTLNRARKSSVRIVAGVAQGSLRALNNARKRVMGTGRSSTAGVVPASSNTARSQKVSTRSSGTRPATHKSSTTQTPAPRRLATRSAATPAKQPGAKDAEKERSPFWYFHILKQKQVVDRPQRRSPGSKVGGAGKSALQALNGGRKRTLSTLNGGRKRTLTTLNRARKRSVRIVAGVAQGSLRALNNIRKGVMGLCKEKSAGKASPENMRKVAVNPANRKYGMFNKMGI